MNQSYRKSSYGMARNLIDVSWRSASICVFCDAYKSSDKTICNCRKRLFVPFLRDQKQKYIKNKSNLTSSNLLKIETSSNSSESSYHSEMSIYLRGVNQSPQTDSSERSYQSDPIKVSLYQKERLFSDSNSSEFSDDSITSTPENMVFMRESSELSDSEESEESSSTSYYHGDKWKLISSEFDKQDSSLPAYVRMCRANRKYNN
jgi:hypothetical protein